MESLADEKARRHVAQAWKVRGSPTEASTAGFHDLRLHAYVNRAAEAC